jgi:parvulin-like peptidyl-prolyl isomerase
MMTTLRSQMKLILWILVFAFLATIVFSWGMGGFKERGPKPGVLGVVAGTQVNAEAFEQVVNRKVQYQTSQGEKEMDEDARKKLREDTWDEQVETMLKRNVARKLKLDATDREIAYVIENNPPNEVRKVPAFQTDSTFDISKYQKFLRDPQATQFLLGMEESVRNYLTEQSLLFRVTAAAVITEEEIKDNYLENTAVGKLRFMIFPFDGYKVDSSDVTDDMMRRYYQLFQDKYRTFAQRRFAYVKFKLAPSHADSTDVLTEAGRLMEELRAGEDFASLATQYSQDAASAAKGGDLGWFGKGAMVKEFEEAVSTAKPGDLLGPVQSKFGAHIINLEDRREGEEGPEFLARHILLKIEPSADTRDQVYTDASNFQQGLKDQDFAALAQANSYEVDTTGLFSESGYIGGLGRMRMAAEFCFNNPVGAVSDVYPTPDGYVVFKIVDATVDGTKSYDEVRDPVRKALEKIIQRQRAWDDAAEMRGKIQSVDDMASQASLTGITLYESDDSLRVSGSLPGGLKRDKDFLIQAFRLDEGDISDVITTKFGCYIAYIEKKSRFDKDDYMAAHTAIYQQLANDKAEAADKNWIRELRVAANIKDYRYRYYRDF